MDTDILFVLDKKENVAHPILPENSQSRESTIEKGEKRGELNWEAEIEGEDV